MNHFNSLDWILSVHNCAHFLYNACAKGLETQSWKVIVVNSIWQTGSQGQKMIIDLPIYCHFRFTSGETSTRKTLPNKFYSNKFYCYGNFRGSPLAYFWATSPISAVIAIKGPFLAHPCEDWVQLFKYLLTKPSTDWKSDRSVIMEKSQEK